MDVYLELEVLRNQQVGRLNVCSENGEDVLLCIYRLVVSIFVTKQLVHESRSGDCRLSSET